MENIFAISNKYTIFAILFQTYQQYQISMKKFYVFLMAVIALTAMSFNASAVSLRLDIDTPANVTVENENESLIYQNLVAGLNTLEVEAGTTIKISANPGCSLVSVAETNDDWYDDLPIYGEDGVQYCYINVYSDYGDIYVVKTASNQEVDTATLTLNVDNPAKVIATLISSDRVLELAEGENTIKYNPEMEKKGLKITPVDKDLYQVKVNGQVLPSKYSYTIDLEDGMTVDVLAEYPDIDYAVKFILTGDEPEDFLQSVYVDNKYITPAEYLDDNFTVKAGSELILTGRTNEYNVNSFKINGISAGFSTTTTILVTNELTVELDVEKIATFKITLTVDNPDHIVLYNGYHYNGDVITLQPGANVINVSRQNPRLDIVPVEGYYIESIQLSEYTYDVEELKGTFVDLYPLYPGDNVNITTDVINRNLKGMLYLSNLAAASDFFSFKRSSGIAPIQEVVEGYNEFAFFNRDNTFKVETGAPINSYVYVNEEEVSPTYPESPYYDVDLNNNDVIKVFFAESAPEIYTVTVDMEDVTETIALTRDYIVDVADWESGFSALQGSYFSINPFDVVIEVKLDDTKLKADEDGNFNFTLNGNSTLMIKKVNSGITGIDSSDEAPAYYDLQGLRIDNPTRPGIYIRVTPKGAEKYVVR